MTVFIAFMALAIGLAEGIPLGKQRQWKELAVMCGLLILALLLVVSYSLGLPPPLVLLQRLIEPVGKVMFK